MTATPPLRHGYCLILVVAGAVQWQAVCIIQGESQEGVGHATHQVTRWSCGGPVEPAFMQPAEFVKISSLVAEVGRGHVVATARTGPHCGGPRSVFAKRMRRTAHAVYEIPGCVPMMQGTSWAPAWNLTDDFAFSEADLDCTEHREVASWNTQRGVQLLVSDMRWWVWGHTGGASVVAQQPAPEAASLVLDIVTNITPLMQQYGRRGLCALSAQTHLHTSPCEGRMPACHPPTVSPRHVPGKQAILLVSRPLPCRMRVLGRRPRCSCSSVIRAGVDRIEKPSCFSGVDGTAFSSPHEAVEAFRPAMFRPMVWLARPWGCRASGRVAVRKKFVFCCVCNAWVRATSMIQKGPGPEAQVHTWQAGRLTARVVPLSRELVAALRDCLEVSCSNDAF